MIYMSVHLLIYLLKKKRFVFDQNESSHVPCIVCVALMCTPVGQNVSSS